MRYGICTWQANKPFRNSRIALAQVNQQSSVDWKISAKVGNSQPLKVVVMSIWTQLTGGGSWGVLLALDEHSGFPLYLAFIENETASDYEAAIRSIEERGYTIFGIIIDGKKSLFTLFSDYQIQMCQFHMKQVIRRYLTQNQRLKAAR